VAQPDGLQPRHLWRWLALPKGIGNWSLTSLQQRLVKTGGRLIKHARYYWLLLADSHLTRRLFGGIAAQDRDGGVTSGIGEPQSAANLIDETEGREKCLRNRLEKRHFWGLRGHEALN